MKYAIINIEVLEKRIEYLKIRELNKWEQDELRILNLILSYSIPLEQELEKAFNVGFQTGYNDEISPSYLTAKEYINNLKLSI